MARDPRTRGEIGFGHAEQERLRVLLRGAAPAVHDPLDADDVLARALRINRHRAIGAAAAVLVLLAPVGLLGRSVLVPVTEVGFGGVPPAVEQPVPGPTAHEPTAPPAELDVAATPTLDPDPPVGPDADGDAGAEAAGEAATPAPDGGATPTPTPSGGSHATVVIRDPPAAESGARSDARPPLPGDRVHPGIVVRMTVARTTVGAGQRWSGELVVGNTGEEAVELGDARCWAVWGLYREGRWVGGQAGSSCDEDAPTRRLEPGGSLRVDVEFDTSRGAADGGRDGDLEAGLYDAAIGLRVATDAHRYSGVWYAPPVQVRIRS